MFLNFLVSVNLSQCYETSASFVSTYPWDTHHYKVTGLVVNLFSSTTELCNGDLFRRSWVRTSPPGSEVFSLSSCGLSFRAIAHKVSFALLIFVLLFNIVLSGQTFLVTPSLTCSFAANLVITCLPRPAPIWPCSYVPEVVGSNPTGVRDFFSSLSVWAHFLSRANAEKVLFRIFVEQFNLPHLKPQLRNRFTRDSNYVTNSNQHRSCKNDERGG